MCGVGVEHVMVWEESQCVGWGWGTLWYGRRVNVWDGTQMEIVLPTRSLATREFKQWGLDGNCPAYQVTGYMRLQTVGLRWKLSCLPGYWLHEAPNSWTQMEIVQPTSSLAT